MLIKHIKRRFLFILVVASVRDHIVKLIFFLKKEVPFAPGDILCCCCLMLPVFYSFERSDCQFNIFLMCIESFVLGDRCFFVVGMECLFYVCQFHW